MWLASGTTHRADTPVYIVREIEKENYDRK